MISSPSLSLPLCLPVSTAVCPLNYCLPSTDTTTEHYRYKPSGMSLTAAQKLALTRDFAKGKRKTPPSLSPPSLSSLFACSVVSTNHVLSLYVYFAFIRVPGG